MTIAQQFKAEGKAEGRSEGEAQAKKTIAQKLLRKGMQITAVSRITDLPAHELEILTSAESH